MKKQPFKKIILLMITFMLFLSPVFIPITAKAEIPLDWKNPTKGKNPFSFKLSEIVNSDVMMSVVGCTGVVNRVSRVIMSIFQTDEYTKELKTALKKMATKITESQCQTVATTATAGAGAAPQVTISNATKVAAEYCTTLKTENPELYAMAIEELKLDKTTKFREECLNGIAIALAKRQLVSMTRSTMNWITSGFEGDPMYVRDINKYMNSITNRIINEEIQFFQNADPYYYPYGRDYARSQVFSYKYRENFVDSLKQTLSQYLTFGNDYNYGNYDAYNYESSEGYNYGVVDKYANDFSSGGWNGWLAFTQYERNNPLGFNIVAQDEAERKEAEKTTEAEKELDRGEGYFSQKKCIKTGLTTKSAALKEKKALATEAVTVAQEKLDEALHYYEIAGGNNNDIEDLTDAQDNVVRAREKYEEALAYSDSIGASLDDLEEKECKEWEIVTPGSAISDTVKNYLNSPVRQLELADTINETLSILFDNLINKFRKEGLTSIGYSTGGNFTNVSSSFGSNSSAFDTSGNKITVNSSGNSGWNKPFDLKTDLGNTYIRETTKELGKWDAKNNSPKLFPNSGEENKYYTVTTPGRTILVLNDLNNWETGDRAFFDGEKWQNWKARTNMPSSTGPDLPIEKRGIIQIQQDYIASAMNLLTFLPSVMPKIGELDYCIPGPNPSWQANSSETQVTFSDFISTLKADYTAGAFLKRDSVMINAPSTNSFEYRSYKNTFDRSSLWDRNYTEDIYEPFQIKGESNYKSGYDYANPGTVQSTKPWMMIYAPADDSTYRGGTVYHLTTHGDWPDWKGNAGIADANNLVNDTIMNIMSLFEKFNKEYDTFVNNNYGKKSSMQTEFILNEAYEVTTRNNTAYLEMAPEGLQLTKNILFYDEEINTLTEEKKDDIITAKSNISKLLQIKKEVSVIIDTAQKRRDTEGKAKIIAQIMEQNKVNEDKALLIYEECKKEEKIYYIDAEDLIGLDKKEDRCSDSLDNDLDGYIDQNDADCNGTGNIEIGVRGRGERSLSGFTGTEYNSYGTDLNLPVTATD